MTRVRKSRARRSRYIVMTRATAMPRSVRVPYRKVALVEVTMPRGQEPKMISPRAHGVVRVVKQFDRLHLGFKPKGDSAVERMQHELQAEADALNART